MPFPFLEYIGVSIIVTAGFSFCWQFLPFRKWNKLKYIIVLHLQLLNTQKYMILFQYLSLGFILKIFLKFRKFQPHILIKYILIEKRVYLQKRISFSGTFFLLATLTPDSFSRQNAFNLMFSCESLLRRDFLNKKYKSQSQELI